MHNLLMLSVRYLTGCPVKHGRVFWYHVNSVTQKMSSVIELYVLSQSKIEAPCPRKVAKIKSRYLASQHWFL